MDEQRALLDQLMGQHRNMSLEEQKKYTPRTRSYRDKEVCKHYLCGFCPYEEFRRTKNDCGDCPCVHDEDAKREWDALDDRSKERTGYEDDLKKWMDRLLVDLKKRIDTNTERLQAAEKPLFLVEDQQRLDAMSARINELLAQSQALGEQGDVDGAQQAMFEADQVKVQRSVLEQQAGSRAGSNALKGLQQTVCPISGLIINKEESRIQDHLEGRNYNSWKKMHEVYSRLQDTFRRREDERRRGRYGDSRRDDRRDRYPARESERERDRGHRDDRGSSRDYSRRDYGSREHRGERDRYSRGERDRGDRYGDRDRHGSSRRDRERSPARPSRPRVSEDEFVVEYTNERAAAAGGSKQRASAPAAEQAYAAGGAEEGAYYDTAYYEAYPGAGPAAGAAAGASAAGAAAGAAAAPAADTQDWGVDYGPARPLQQQHGEGYYPA